MQQPMFPSGGDRIHHREGRWFVRVAILNARTCEPEHYAMGPFASWSRARDIATLWEDAHGDNTAHVTVRPHEEMDGRMRGQP